MATNYIRQAFKEGTMISTFNLRSAMLLGAPAHLVFYFVFKYGFKLPYENVYLRMTAVFLLVSFAFYHKIPDRLRAFFPVYWHFTIIFVLPFIFTVNLLMNNFHELWLYWEIFMLFILITYVPNWLMFLVDLVIGAVGALAFYTLYAPQFHLIPNFNVPLYLLVIFFTIGAGYIFSYSNKKGQLAIEKNEALQALAAGIAHEMRNPLGQVRYNLEAIEEKVADIRMVGLTGEALERISAGVAQGQMAVNRGVQVIDMILEEVRSEDPLQNQASYFSVVALTRKALAEYGYESDEERRKVHFSDAGDFLFKGNESMYVFVLFNLIMNALYFLRLYPSGGIFITTGRRERMNIVIVRDTGPGIAREHLDMIFDPFFTSGKKGGTGLGLPYCKRVMRLFGGDIGCDSVLGEYTEFTLSFPPVNREQLLGFEKRIYEQHRDFFTGRRLLLADADELQLQRIRGMLMPLGVEISTAIKGREVVEQLSLMCYDLLLCNGALRVDEGRLLLTFLNEGTLIDPSVFPVVVYSDDLSSAFISKTSFSGITELLFTPLTLQPLVAALSTALCLKPACCELKNLSEKKVLLVDDSSINRIAVREMLKHLGFVHVFEAANGLDALDILARSSLDLLLLDIQMPVLDGIEVARRVRKGDTANSQVPIVAMSGESDGAIIEEAMQNGMNAYLVKPIDRQLMQQKILQVI